VLVRKALFSLFGIGLVAWSAALALTAQSADGQRIVEGLVTSRDGRPLEGVFVSARASDSTFTTSVLTDRRGAYAFPPLDAGQYTLWAQAVGFEAGRATFVLKSDGRVERNLRLAPTSDIAPQLDGIEWMHALPEVTPQDLRMKKIFQANCTGCHQPSFVLANRFDVRGWALIIEFMARGLSFASPLPTHGQAAAVLRYKDELAEYLARVRGITDMARFKVPARPSGEATQVVITEYDITFPTRPGYVMAHNGADWSEGTPSRFEGRSAHDVVIDSKGVVWFSDDRTPGRTIGRLDPRTGKITDFPSLNEKGVARSTFILEIDAQDNLWATSVEEGNFLKFDTRAEQFHVFEREPGIGPVAAHMSIDSQGNPSAQAAGGDGIIRLDVSTGRHTYYRAITPKQGEYGVAVDAKDRVWMARSGGDKFMVVDARTGKVDEVSFEPLRFPWLTPKDIDIANTMEGGANFGWPHHRAPRRPGADLNGDTMWSPMFKSDTLARININTKEIKEFPLPTRYSGPYSTVVDKHGIVWAQLLNGDRIVSFNPKTERFVEYQLPTRGTQMRDLRVDDSTDPPTIWAAYGGTSKLMRMQLRGK
jgi:virginiamycin B lyase